MLISCDFVASIVERRYAINKDTVHGQVWPSGVSYKYLVDFSNYDKLGHLSKPHVEPTQEYWKAYNFDKNALVQLVLDYIANAK